MPVPGTGDKSCGAHTGWPGWRTGACPGPSPEPADRQTDIEIKGTERQSDIEIKEREVDRQTTIEMKETERQMDTEKRQIEEQTETQP